MELIDYLIVGSGCTGAMVAETLCSSGKKVMMLDAGLENTNTNTTEKDFITLRKADINQRDILLGPNLEALAGSTHPNIPQQTAQRKFMTALTDQLIPVSSQNFFPVESLALGGLGNGWGLGSYTFSDTELQKAGLNITDMKKAYHTVANRIGISGNTNDDASIYCNGNGIPLQKSIEINDSAASLYQSYSLKKKDFHKKGLYLGRPSLALLTEEKNARSAYQYKDLDFYSNEGNSAYRPSCTINALIEKGKLMYRGKLLVKRFTEFQQYIEVECISIDSNEIVVFRTKKLILASGTLGSARIVLRSFNSDLKLPVLCNAYTYMPFMHWPFIGKKNDGQLSGFAQLALFYDKNKDHADVAMASIYNYRSLLHFRIMQQMPLNFADGIKMLKLLIPGLFIAGIFHPAEYNPKNYIELQQSEHAFTKDILHTHYIYSTEEEKKIRETEKQISKAINSLRCTVLKKIRTLTGASIHYAGTLPFSRQETKFSVSPEGKLYHTNNVFVADGSGFTFLPGKGLTLSLMAYAHSVAEKVLKDG